MARTTTTARVPAKPTEAVATKEQTGKRKSDTRSSQGGEQEKSKRGKVVQEATTSATRVSTRRTQGREKAGHVGKEAGEAEVAEAEEEKGEKPPDNPRQEEEEVEEEEELTDDKETTDEETTDPPWQPPASEKPDAAQPKGKLQPPLLQEAPADTQTGTDTAPAKDGAAEASEWKSPWHRFKQTIPALLGRMSVKPMRDWVAVTTQRSHIQTAAGVTVRLGKAPKEAVAATIMRLMDTPEMFGYLLDNPISGGRPWEAKTTWPEGLLSHIPLCDGDVKVLEPRAPASDAMALSSAVQDARTRSNAIRDSMECAYGHAQTARGLLENWETLTVATPLVPMKAEIAPRPTPEQVRKADHAVWTEALGPWERQDESAFKSILGRGETQENVEKVLEKVRIIRKAQRKMVGNMYDIAEHLSEVSAIVNTAKFNLIARALGISEKLTAALLKIAGDQYKEYRKTLARQGDGSVHFVQTAARLTDEQRAFVVAYYNDPKNRNSRLTTAAIDNLASVVCAKPVVPVAEWEALDPTAPLVIASCDIRTTGDQPLVSRSYAMLSAEPDPKGEYVFAWEPSVANKRTKKVTPYALAQLRWDTFRTDEATKDENAHTFLCWAELFEKRYRRLPIAYFEIVKLLMARTGSHTGKEPTDGTAQTTRLESHNLSGTSWRCMWNEGAVPGGFVPGSASHWYEWCVVIPGFWRIGTNELHAMAKAVHEAMNYPDSRPSKACVPPRMGEYHESVSRKEDEAAETGWWNVVQQELAKDRPNYDAAVALLYEGRVNLKQFHKAVDLADADHIRRINCMENEFVEDFFDNVGRIMYGAFLRIVTQDRTTQLMYMDEPEYRGPTGRKLKEQRQKEDTTCKWRQRRSVPEWRRGDVDPIVLHIFRCTHTHTHHARVRAHVHTVPATQDTARLRASCNEAARQTEYGRLHGQPNPPPRRELQVDHHGAEEGCGRLPRVPQREVLIFSGSRRGERRQEDGNASATREAFQEEAQGRQGAVRLGRGARSRPRK